MSRLITYAELLGWCREFDREPFDDRRCFDRPATVIKQTLFAINNPDANGRLTVAELMPYQDPLSPEELTAKLME